MTLADLKRNIKRKMIAIAEYEEAIARLGDTAGVQWISILKIRLEQNKESLKALETRHRTIATRHHAQRLPKESYVPVISIAGLIRVISAESDAWDDMVALRMAWHRLNTELVLMEQELGEKKQVRKRRASIRPSRLVKVTADDGRRQRYSEDLRRRPKQQGQNKRTDFRTETNSDKGIWSNDCGKPCSKGQHYDDCMLGLIISTSNGNGLRLKGASIKDRSVPIVNEFSIFSGSSDWGKDLHPKQKLRVQSSREYNPPAGAYVDMLSTIMIPYDSRFQKKGAILKDDILALQRMRLSAVLANSGARALGY